MVWRGELDIWLETPDGGTPSAREVVEGFLAGGWTTTDPIGPGISFLPSDGDDEGDWLIASHVTIEEVLSAIDLRERAGQMAGVILTWADTGIGGQVLLFERGHMSLLPNINTVRDDDGRTDFRWYLRHLTEALGKAGIRMERFEAMEHG